MRPDKTQHLLAEDEVRALDQAVILLKNQPVRSGYSDLKIYPFACNSIEKYRTTHGVLFRTFTTARKVPSRDLKL